VLKRFERFFTFKQKGVLKDDSSVFGMPKLKIVRQKIKKEKAEEKPEDVQAVVAEGGATPGKEAAPKAQKEEKGKKKEEKGKK